MKEYIITINEFFSLIVEVVKGLWNLLIIGIGAIVSVVFYITGGQDKMMGCLLILMLVDYISGIIKGVIKEELNSKTGFKGLLKKLIMILVIVLAYQIDILLNNKLALKTLMIGVLISNEGLSILENASICGIPIPDKLKNILEQYKNKRG